MTRSEEIAKAREVDTRIAAAWTEYHRITAPLPGLRKNLESRKKGLELAKAKGWDQRVLEEEQDIGFYQERIANITTAAFPFSELANKIDREEYTGWTRFFLVQHIHNTQYCSSFRPTTRVGWLPDVSGLTEAEAVAEHGATLCTICFPSAPVELTTPKADPNTCPGSGTNLDRSLPHRTGYVYGNWGTCPACGAQPAVTKTFKLLKHKPAK